MIQDDDQTNQFLTFVLSGEIFGIATSSVLELIEYVDITPVPQTHDFRQGVINLRGSIVPVVDLHYEFNLSVFERTVNSCIIIITIIRDGEPVNVGIVADSVRAVVDLAAENIEDAPHMGSKLKSNFIRGMGKHNGEFIILLNVDAIFLPQQIVAVD